MKEDTNKRNSVIKNSLNDIKAEYQSTVDGLFTELEGEYRVDSVADSLFYLVFLLMVLPGIVGFITDAFHLKYLSETELGALSLTNAYDSITMIVTVLFPIGAQTVIAKSLGGKERENTAGDYTSIILGQTVVVVIVAVISILFRYPIVRILGADEGSSIMRPAAMLIVFFACGMIPSSLKNTLFVLLYMEVESRKAILYSSLSAPLINIVGYVYVTATGPSLFGYTLAGVLSEYAGLIIVMIYKRARSLIYRFDPSLFSIKRFWHMTNIGLPAGAEYLYVAIYEFLIIRFTIHTFSEIYLPVFEIEDDINVIAEFFVAAMCTILVYRLGVVYGEGNRERLKKEIKKTWIVCLILSVVVAVICLILYPYMVMYIVEGFGPNTALIKEEAIKDLCLVSIATPFYAANNIFTSVYEVRELVKHAHLNYILETCLLYVFFSVLLSQMIGVAGLWAAYPAAEASTLLVNFALMIIYNKRLPADWLDFMFPGPADLNKAIRESD